MSGYASDQIFLAIDIEADGPQPGKNSMLSIAGIATTAAATVGELFYRKLLPIPNGEQNPDTMAWWAKHQDAWKEATSGAEPPETVIADFVKWCEQFDNPIFVSHPTVFDFKMVSWYLEQYHGTNIFQTPTMMRALDLPSYISGKFGLELSQSYRSQLPKHLLQGMPEHTHGALDDALGVAVMLRNVLAAKGDMK
jgi:hypothetical protein